jgi:hypothetical protein
MKKNLLYILVLSCALAFLGWLSISAFYRPMGQANSQLADVHPVRAVRLDFLDYPQSRLQMDEMESKMKAAGVNMVGVGAGRVDWAYFPWKNHSSQWSADVKNTGIDFLADDSSRFGKWAHVSAVVDVLAPLYIKQHPEAAAVSSTGSPSENLVGVMDMVEGDYSKNLLDMIQDIAANYPVNSVTITEMVYYVDGFGEKDKAAYDAFTHRNDWPRKADGAIDINDPTIGDWRSYELDLLYKKAAAILHQYNKQLFIEVHVSVDDQGYVYTKNGVNFDTLLRNADRLLVWGSYNQDEHKSEVLSAIGSYLARRDSDQVIMTIGLWNHNYDVNTPKESMLPIPVEDLQIALHKARQGGAADFFITPSFLLSDAHWKTLAEGWKP